MAKSQSKAGTGQHMGRETRVWMPRNQSKAGMGIAYGQRNKSEDGEKSVQNRHKSNKMADKNNKIGGDLYETNNTAKNCRVKQNIKANRH